MGKARKRVRKGKSHSSILKTTKRVKENEEVLKKLKSED